jgi:proton-dependent oligopeptide transporter, POT family
MILTGHPPGTYLLSFTEIMERFSYYTMSGLLALFLVAPVSSGGWGWPTGDALRFYGIYTSLVWFAPLLGGWIADRHLGAKRAVMAGGFLIAAGQGLMTAPLTVPWALDVISGTVVSEKLAKLTTLGHPFGGVANIVPGISCAYLASALIFFCGLAVLAIGNGLLKPNITVMLGQLYDPSDLKRDAGFTLFYIAINIGAVLSALVAGTVAERYGWCLGFGVASATMLIGTLVFFLNQRRLLHGIGEQIGRNHAVTVSTVAATPGCLRSTTFIVILALFATLFWTAYLQTGGMLSLFVHDRVDRMAGGFLVPASWFNSLTPFYIILLGPLFQHLLMTLERRGWGLDTVARFVAGLSLASLAFIYMAVAVPETGGKNVTLVVPALFYLGLTAAELSLSPAGNAMASRYAPPELAGRMMAVWMLCLAFGSLFAGFAGALTASYPMRSVIGGLGLILASAALTLWLMRSQMRRLVTV